ncbi:MAG: hypothetical protein ACXAB4_14410 [Candidatus Hodarchaeales archaeon]
MEYLALYDLAAEDAFAIEFVSGGVLYEITFSNSSTSFSVVFSGHYFFFNPNETQTIQIAFPFYPTYEDEFPKSANFQVLVFNESVPFTMIDYESLTGDNYWSRSMWKYYGSGIEFLFFNATLEKQTITPILVSFQGNISLGDVAYITFDYIVETANAWSGNIRELVQFNTWDGLPDLYYPNESAIISQGLRAGRIWGNYSWFFSAKPIGDRVVGIRFSNPAYSHWDFEYTTQNSPLEVLIIVIALDYLGVSVLRKKRKFKCDSMEADWKHVKNIIR